MVAALVGFVDVVDGTVLVVLKKAQFALHVTYKLYNDHC